MTSTATSGRAGAPTGSRPARPDHGGVIEPRVAALEAATDAGRTLGLDVELMEAVRRETAERLGLASEAYVLALIGGTGVGKSSLLNAIAGATVSVASVRRPTTARPVAWIAASAAARVAPVLDRLGVVDRRLHDGGPDGAVILDLPDVDSVDESHIAEVEALLPRVDAVAWVTDPEKYADAVLHDGFLRRWIPRLGRQLVVLNKSDRLADRDVERVGGDLARLLATELGGSGSSRPDVVAVSAAGGSAGVAPLRAWLDAAIDAKAVVAGRLAAAAAAAVTDLAREAGAVDDAGRHPLVGPEARRRAVVAASAEVLRVVDLEGVERRAVAATRARARPRGAGPLGPLTAFVYRWSGRERRVADPDAYLRAWRDRGTAVRGGAPVHEMIATAVAAAPPALRPRLAEAGEPRAMEARIAGSVDRAIAGHPPLAAPTSRVWPVLGLLQTFNTALLVFAAAWLLVWILARPPVATVDVPLLGPVPMPFALLAAGLAVGLLLARLLSFHAGRLGRRWARGVGEEIRSGVETAIAGEAFATLDRVESARRALWAAARAVEAARG